MRSILGLLLVNGVLLLLFHPINAAGWATLALLNVLWVFAVAGGRAVPAGAPHSFFAYAIGSMFLFALIAQFGITVLVLALAKSNVDFESKTWLRIFTATEFVIIGAAVYGALQVAAAGQRVTKVVEQDTSARGFARRTAASANAIAERAGSGPIRDSAVAVAEALLYAPTATSPAVQPIEDAIESSLRQARVHLGQGDAATAAEALADALDLVEQRTKEIRWGQ